MGIYRTDYVIYGVNVGYDNVSWDEFTPELEGHPGVRFDIIYDGNNGKYAYAGKILLRGDSYEGFGDGVSLKPMDESHLAAAFAVMKAFPDLKLNMNSFGYFVVTCFS